MSKVEKLIITCFGDNSTFPNREIVEIKRNKKPSKIVFEAPSNCITSRQRNPKKKRYQSQSVKVKTKLLCNRSLNFDSFMILFQIHE